MAMAAMRTKIYAILFVKVISALSINSTTERPLSELCSTTFEYATASPNCTRYENTTCNFECNSGYTRPNDDVNMTLLCTLDGWESPEKLCEVYKCQDGYNNATASQNCSRHENTSCEFVCNHGYSRANNDTSMKMTCTQQGWDYNGILCIKDFQCERGYENASVSDNCTRLENSTCEFTCNRGYVQSNTSDNLTLTCTQENGWIGQQYLCVKDNSTNVTDTKPPWSAPVVLGVVIAVGAFVLVLALVVIITICQKRRIKNHIASFSNVAVRYTTSNVGIDNPAYKAEINGYSDSRDIIEEDAEGEATQGGGGEDSPDAAQRYSSRYSLSGLEGIDLDDSAVLTSESWQREKSAFPEHLQ